MAFLEQFELVDEDANRNKIQKIENSCSKDERFPIGFFAKKQLRQIDFENITVFCGGNGSGKSTLLSLIAEKLNLKRIADAAPTKAFYDYCDLCKIRAKGVPRGSTMLTSEDVFKNIFSTRANNSEINDVRSDLDDFIDQTANDFMFEGFENSQLISKELVKRSYAEKNSAVKERQYSNGENALKFFKGEINKKALYLLDEPENSMSPKYQLELKTFLEDAARLTGSQFIISTHSPFILAIEGAKIYNLDETPVSVEKWYNLKSMRLYYSFFLKYKDLFQPDEAASVKKSKPKAAKKP